MIILSPPDVTSGGGGMTIAETPHPDPFRAAVDRLLGPDPHRAGVPDRPPRLAALVEAKSWGWVSWWRTR